MKRFIMKRAWAIYRTLVGDRIAKLTQALKMAWAEVKNVVEDKPKTIVEKLQESGYYIWKGGEHQRIYINDYARYSEFIQTDDVVSYGHKNIIVNGIDVWETATKQSIFNRFAKTFEEVDGEINGNYGIQIWYNVVEGSWYSSKAKGCSYLESMVKAVINHFNS